MKPCHDPRSVPCCQQQPKRSRGPEPAATQAVPLPPAPPERPETPVRHYCHPIRTTFSSDPRPRGPELGQVLAALDRQSALLEELLRRLDSDNLETK